MFMYGQLESFPVYTTYLYIVVHIILYKYNMCNRWSFIRPTLYNAATGHNSEHNRVIKIILFNRRIIYLENACSDMVC